MSYNSGGKTRDIVKDIFLVTFKLILQLVQSVWYEKCVQ